MSLIHIGFDHLPPVLGLRFGRCWKKRQGGFLTSTRSATRKQCPSSEKRHVSEGLCNFVFRITSLLSDFLKLSPTFCFVALSYLRVTAPTCSHFLAKNRISPERA
eukprot:sb/3478015/